MTDEARAVEEVAKTAGEIVKLTGRAGAYLDRVFGSIPDNLLGLGVGDWLDHKRRRHLAQLEANTALFLEGIAAERRTEPSASVLIPLLQAAVDEGRPELQALWAALLANAMLDGGKRVRRDYFAVVGQMEPVDASVLDLISNIPHPGSNNAPEVEEAHRFVLTRREQLSISDDEFAISVDKLDRLGCALGRVRRPELKPFGRGLVAACRVL